MSLAFIAATLHGRLAFSGDRNWETRGSAEVIADFDEDGRPDLATLDGNDRVVVELSQHQTTVRLVRLPETTGLAAADIDGDGDPDLVSIDAGKEIRGWNNQGAGSFIQWTTGPPRARPLEPTPSTRASVGSSTSPTEAAVFPRRSQTDPSFASSRVAVSLSRLCTGLHFSSKRRPDSHRTADRSPRAPPLSLSR